MNPQARHTRTEVRQRRRWYSAILLAGVVLVVGHLRILGGGTTGPSASPGLFYRCSLVALRHGQPSEFRAWILHPRPQVRVLGLVCLAQHRPHDFRSAVEPLTHDESVVWSCPVGCIFTELPISRLVPQIIAEPDMFGHYRIHFEASNEPSRNA